VRSRAIVLILATMITTWAGRRSGGDVYVICSDGVALKADEVRNVFLGEKGFAGSVKLLPADNQCRRRADFLAKVLKLDPSKYTVIWTKNVSRRYQPRPPVRQRRRGIAYVKQTAGACTMSRARRRGHRGREVLGRLDAAEAMKSRTLNANRLVYFNSCARSCRWASCARADGGRSRRAAALEHSRPLRVNAQRARNQYKAFFAGVADAVDSGRWTRRHSTRSRQPTRPAGPYQ